MHHHISARPGKVRVLAIHVGRNVYDVAHPPWYSTMRKMQRMMMATVVRHITTQRMRQSWKGVTLKKPKSFPYDSPAPILQISGCAVRLGKDGQSGTLAEDKLYVRPPSKAE